MTDPFTYGLDLLRLHRASTHGQVTSVIRPSLEALPSRTYSQGRLVKVDGIYTSAYLRKIHGQTPPEDLTP